MGNYLNKGYYINIDNIFSTLLGHTSQELFESIKHFIQKLLKPNLVWELPNKKMFFRCFVDRGRRNLKKKVYFSFHLKLLKHPHQFKKEQRTLNKYNFWETSRNIGIHKLHGWRGCGRRDVTYILRWKTIS